VARVLNREVSKAADTEDRDKIPRLGRRAPDPLERVSPAHNKGAASTDDNSSGTDTNPVAFAIMTSA